MEPNHQLFGHYLRYRIEMQQDPTEQRCERPSRYMKRSGVGVAIGTFLRYIVSYYRRIAVIAEAERSPDMSQEEVRSRM